MQLEEQHLRSLYSENTRRMRSACPHWCRAWLGQFAGERSAGRYNVRNREYQAAVSFLAGALFFDLEGAWRKINISSNMKATHWEFTNRAALRADLWRLVSLIFPGIVKINRCAGRLDCIHFDEWMRIWSLGLLFALAALLLVRRRFIRTWASSYLHAEVSVRCRSEDGVAGCRWALPPGPESALLCQCVNGHRHGRHDEPRWFLWRWWLCW